MNIQFTVPGKPVGKGRPRFSTRGGFVKTYTPEKTASFENLVKLAFQQAAPAGFVPFGKDTALEMVITARFTPPESASKKKREAMLLGDIRPTGRPDLDNCCKLIADSLHDICYANDACIVRMIAEKRYSQVAETVVEVREIEGANSPK